MGFSPLKSYRWKKVNPSIFQKKMASGVRVSSFSLSWFGFTPFLNPAPQVYRDHSSLSWYISWIRVYRVPFPDPVAPSSYRTSFISASRRIQVAVTRQRDLSGSSNTLGKINMEPDGMDLRKTIWISKIFWTTQVPC